MMIFLGYEKNRQPAIVIPAGNIFVTPRKSGRYSHHPVSLFYPASGNLG